MLEFQGLEEVVLEIQGLQDPWARDIVKDTVKDTAMCVQVEQDFVVYFDALPKKPKIEVRIVDL
jgi:hypothetical protein